MIAVSGFRMVIQLFETVFYCALVVTFITVTIADLAMLTTTTLFSAPAELTFSRIGYFW